MYVFESAGNNQNMMACPVLLTSSSTYLPGIEQRFFFNKSIFVASAVCKGHIVAPFPCFLLSLRVNDRISTPIVFNVSPGVHGLRGVQKDHVQ